MRNDTTTLGRISVHSPHKRRELNPGRVAMLVESISEIGVLNPLTVVENGGGAFRLIAGYHRLQALQNLGATEVPIRIVTMSDQLAELAEIDENLVRSELTALERADVIARRKGIFEALHPEAKHGTAAAAATSRGKGGTFEAKPDEPPELSFDCDDCGALAGGWCHSAKGSRVLRLHKSRRLKVAAEEQTTPPVSRSFAEDTAKKTGRSKRAVQEDAQIGEAMKSFPAGVRKAIEKSPMANRKKDLLELARLDDTARLGLFDVIESAHHAGSPIETLAHARAALENDDDASLEDAHGNKVPEDLAAFWDAMSAGAVQSVAHAVRASASQWTKAKKGLAAIRELHQRPVATDELLRTLDESFSTIRATAKLLELLIPDMVCPACKGADLKCGGCGGSGFLPAASAKEHTRKNESREQSRKKRGKRAARR